VEVDVVGEGVRLKGEDHALEYHLLIEVWGAKGSLAEAIDKCQKRLALFLPDAEEWYCSSLVRAAASEISGKHVWEGVVVVDRVWWEGREPFEGGAFGGGRKGFAKDCVMGSVKCDVGDVDFEVFVGVGFTSVTLQCEGFPLGEKAGVGDEVGERVTMFG